MAVAVVVIAVVAGAAGTALAVGQGGAAPGNQTISVSSSGQVELAPDAAVVTLSVTATGQNPANVTNAVAADADRLRNTLAEFGISDEHVQSQHFSVRGAERRHESAGPTQYVAQQQFEVTLQDTERAGDLIDAAIDGGAHRVRGVRFTLSESTREGARDDALRNAVAEARTDASVLAEAGDMEVRMVHSISTTGTDVRPYRVEAEAAAGDGGGIAPRIDTQDVTVTADVRVVFATA